MQRGPSAVQQVPVWNSPMQCDCLYSRTWPGIIKIVQVVSSLIGFFCMQNVYGLDFATDSGVVWFRITAMSGLAVSTLFLFLYFLHLIKTCDNISWLKIECISSIIWTIFNLSAAAKMVSITGNCNNREHPNICAQVASATAFGFIAMVAYTCDAGFQLYRIMKRIPAQG